MLVLYLLCLCSNLNNFKYKPQVESRQQHLALYTERHLRSVAIMIEVTSRSALILIWTTVRCLPVRHNRDPDEMKLHFLPYNWTTASSVMKHKSLSSRRAPTSRPPSYWSLHGNHFTSCCCYCRLPDPFWGMGAWRNTIEPQKPGNSPRSGPEVVQRQRVAKEWAAQRVRSWTVQNEMRDVLRRVSTGAARRILGSANPRELKEDCVHCSEDERGHSEHDDGAQVPQWQSREPVCQNIWKRQYASSPRKDESGYEK